MKRKPNITGRLGRFSAEHPWRAVVIWLSFVALAVLAGGAVHTTKLHDSDGQVGESGRAAATIAREFHPHAGENVLLSSSNKTFDDAEYRAAARDVVSAVSATGAVANVRSPLDNPAQVATNGRDAIVSFDVNGESEDAVKRVGPVLDAVAKVARAHPSISIEEAGEASGQKGVEQAVGKDFQTAEKVSIPLALLVLLITFGAVVAALLPLGLALTAILGATGVLAFTSHLAGVDQSASSV